MQLKAETVVAKTKRNNSNIYIGYCRIDTNSQFYCIFNFSD